MKSRPFEKIMRAFQPDFAGSNRISRAPAGFPPLRRLSATSCVIIITIFHAFSKELFSSALIFHLLFLLRWFSDNSYTNLLDPPISYFYNDGKE